MPSPKPESRVSELTGHTSRWIPLAAIAGILLSVGLRLWTRDQERARIAHLPPENRMSMLFRANADLHGTCGLPEAAGGALRAHCVDLANLVLELPECDEPCQDNARRFLPHAQR